jgi:hypothetical protein
MRAVQCWLARTPLSLTIIENNRRELTCFGVVSPRCAAGARVNEVGADLALLGEVLRLPGIKSFLTRRFHPEKADLTDAERQWLTTMMQKVNAAYEALEKKGRP